jgi:hypothetical protein
MAGVFLLLVGPLLSAADLRAGLPSVVVVASAGV